MAQGRGTNELRKQIKKVLVTNKKKITWTWREILKTVLAESESMIDKKGAVKHHQIDLLLQQSRIKKGSLQILVAYLDTTAGYKIKKS